MDPTGLDFGGCYFRQADLRGIDFRKAKLEGASINGARISGAYFPAELAPEELRLSLNYGTRMRYRLTPEPVIIQAPAPVAAPQERAPVAPEPPSSRPLLKCPSPPRQMWPHRHHLRANKRVLKAGRSDRHRRRPHNQWHRNGERHAQPRFNIRHRRFDAARHPCAVTRAS